MATLLLVDGSKVETTGPLTLEAMQRYVGGWIEVVTLAHLPGRGRRVLVIDEEGFLKEKPLNVAATMLYHTVSRSGVIVGDALVAEVYNTGSDDPEHPERWE